MKNLTGWLLQELLSDRHREHSCIRAYTPGAAIFRVGDPGDYLAVLISGTVEIRKGEKIISVVEPGSMFGEMGIIDHQPRMADAVAKTNCKIAEVREGQFMALLEATPYFALSLMRLLTDRFRRQTNT